MEIYVKISVISIFFMFVLVSNMIFIRCVDLPVSQLQTKQMMSSQIRSHINI